MRFVQLQKVDGTVSFVRPWSIIEVWQSDGITQVSLSLSGSFKTLAVTDTVQQVLDAIGEATGRSGS